MNPKELYNLKESFWNFLPAKFMIYKKDIFLLGDVVFRAIVTIIMHQYDHFQHYTALRASITRDLIISENSKIFYMKNNHIFEFNVLIGSLYHYMFIKYDYGSLHHLKKYLNEQFNLINYINIAIKYQIPPEKASDHNVLYQPGSITIHIEPIINDQWDLENKFMISKYIPYNVDYNLLYSVFDPKKYEEYLGKYYGRTNYQYYEYIGDAIYNLIYASILLEAKMFDKQTFLDGISNNHLAYLMIRLGLGYTQDKKTADQFEAIIGIFYIHLKNWSELIYIHQMIKTIFIN